MIDLKALEQDPDGFTNALKRRGAVANLDQLLQLSKERRELIVRREELQSARNKFSRVPPTTPTLDGYVTLLEGKNLATAAFVKEVSESTARILGKDIPAMDAPPKELLSNVSAAVKEYERRVEANEKRLNDLALEIPNPPSPAVPDGTDAHGNVEVRRVLEPKSPGVVKDHVDIGVDLGLLDVERAAKISGARFAFLRGQGARLQRALAAFMLDFHRAAGDVELAPPYLVLPKAMQGTGQLPKFADDAFATTSGHYLIPTAEVPITNFYADEVIDEERLPLRFCAFSPCFRAEAGAAGRDTRGLIRQHQFDKVEMVRFCTPEQADAELELMVKRASDIMSALELPHRVMLLCAGDMGFASEKTYDLEVWLPAQGTYREISSCSTCGQFQARRAQIRCKKGKEKPRPLATLNGSGLAVGRTWIALLENHLQADGSVCIPERLRPYLPGLDALRKDGTIAIP